MTDDLAVALGERFGPPIEGLRRLSGGASRETWSFDAAGRPLILQRRRAGAAELAGSIDVEADLLIAAAAAGVPVPRVIARGDGAADGLGAPWLVSERLDGEALPRRLLRDDRYDGVRPRLAFDCGAALARIHSIDASSFDTTLERSDPIERLREVIDVVGGSYPATELGLRRLELSPPPERPVSLVHGDFRLGNLLVTPAGLAGVLDWELAHLGDPVEDLGWFCVRAWRFGSPLRAGGVGTVDDLLAGYSSVAGDGAGIDADELAWWELLGTLKWAVICALQAEQHLSGVVRSVELATIGRRTCESEYDALRLVREMA